MAQAFGCSGTFLGRRELAVSMEFFPRMARSHSWAPRFRTHVALLSLSGGVFRLLFPCPDYTRARCVHCEWLRIPHVSSRPIVFRFPPTVIVGLPEEVLNSPMGGMLRPLLEQMTTQVAHDRCGSWVLVFHRCVAFWLYTWEPVGSCVLVSKR